MTGNTRLGAFAVGVGLVTVTAMASVGDLPAGAAVGGAVGAPVPIDEGSPAGYGTAPVSGVTQEMFVTDRGVVLGMRQGLGQSQGWDAAEARSEQVPAMCTPESDSRTGTAGGADAGAGPATGAGTDAGMGAGTGAGSGAGTGAGTGPSTGAGTGPGTDAGTAPGTGAGAGTGPNTGTGTGRDFGAGTGTDPGSEGAVPPGDASRPAAPRGDGAGSRADSPGGNGAGEAVLQPVAGSADEEPGAGPYGGPGGRSGGPEGPGGDPARDIDPELAGSDSEAPGRAPGAGRPAAQPPADPEGTVRGGGLPFTGMPAQVLLIAAGLLCAIGCAVALLTARRRRARD